MDPRARKAFDAMKSIGISPSKVKPVLRNLMRLYNNNWELIEEDNYRTLADAIFEHENDEMVKKNDVPESEPVCKKRRGMTLEDHGSTNCSRIIDFEEGEMPQRYDGETLAESSQSFSLNPREATLQYPLDIASSSCGRVKLCLRYNQAIGRPNYRSPNIEELLRYAEKKRMGSYVNLDLKSMDHLLKELCDSYLKLLADSANRSLLSKSPNCCLDHKIHLVREPHGTTYLEKEVKQRVSNHLSTSSSLKNVVVCQRTDPKIHDVTNGTEKVIIPLLDETGREQVPKFVYIPSNIIYQSAYVHVSLARIADEDCCACCIGDCLSSSISCACARDTGGEFAYTPEGILRHEFLSACISMKAEPQKHYHFYCNDCPLERAKSEHAPEKCKGHLVRKFIKECWRKCQCNMKCGNRVVQRGITRKMQVFLTDEGKGWGLRASEVLPKGAFVCEYVGEILTNMELYERNKQRNGRDRHTYPVLLDSDWGSERVLKDEDALCLDGTHYGNVARFINHRCCDANLIEIPVEVETPDHHYYHVLNGLIAFFTKREVKAFEELTWDYGIDFDDENHPIEAFICSCGSSYCRDKKAKRSKAIVLP